MRELDTGQNVRHGLTIRLATNCFRELTTLFEADIARGGTNKPRDGVPVVILRHVDIDPAKTLCQPTHTSSHETELHSQPALFVIEQERGERLAHLGLAHAGRSEEEE